MTLRNSEKHREKIPTVQRHNYCQKGRNNDPLNPYDENLEFCFCNDWDGCNAAEKSRRPAAVAIVASVLAVVLYNLLWMLWLFSCGLMYSNQQLAAFVCWIMTVSVTAFIHCLLIMNVLHVCLCVVSINCSPATLRPRIEWSASTCWLSTNFYSLKVLYSSCKMCNSNCFAPRKRCLVVYSALSRNFGRGREVHAFDAGVWSSAFYKLYLTCRISVYCGRNKGFSSNIISLSHFRLYGAGVWFIIRSVHGQCGSAWFSVCVCVRVYDLTTYFSLSVVKLVKFALVVLSYLVTKKISFQSVILWIHIVWPLSYKST